MFQVKLMVFATFFLSLVNDLWAQSGDTCSFQGQQVSGDFNIPGFCLLYRCIPGQGVTTIGCGIRVPPEGCYILHPATKNYPECCYTNIVCPQRNQTSAPSEAEFGGNELQGSPYPQQQSSFSPNYPQFENNVPQQGLSTPAAPDFGPSDRTNQDFGKPQDVYGPPDQSPGSGPYYYRK